ATGEELARIPALGVGTLAHDTHGLVVARLASGNLPGLERIPLDGGQRQAWTMRSCELLDVTANAVLISERAGNDRVRIARNPTDGAILWQIADGGGLGRHGDTAFVDTAGVIRAVDVRTGSTRWESPPIPEARLIHINAGAGRVWAHGLLSPVVTVLDARDGSILEQGEGSAPYVLNRAGITVLFDEQGLRVWAD
ncbi:MAG: hypothetical protein AAGC55_13495, partial [Myxococcota bacterium]